MADDSIVEGQEQSQMTEFISQYLARENARPSNVEPDSFTHMIGIPLDQCDELLLELESVQRAILYHCPVLAHACLPSAQIRLPLLYVTVPAVSQLTRLEDLLRALIQKHLMREAEAPIEVQRDGTLYGLNSQGVQPVLLKFEGLEMVDDGNSVLSTRVNAESLAAQALSNLLKELQEELATWLWDYQPASDDQGRFQVPFMRLPSNWDGLLPVPKDEDDVLTSDQGGNGISPIFWFKWSEDVFGEAIRMREVAIYPRHAPGLDETAFAFPASWISLPRGSNSLDKHETIFAEYQEKRLTDAEAELQSAEPDVEDVRVDEDDPMLKKTQTRLESLLCDVEELASEVIMGPSDMESATAEQEETMGLRPPRTPSPPDAHALDDWTKERIRKTIESRSRFQREKELTKKNSKPPILENEVFRKYKNGTLAPPSTPAPFTRELPPYPSREHCVGFWRIVSSPTGFDVEEDTAFASDNLILRIDGTTAGGPILDQETRQKASGGTWKFWEDEERLRIRLVIPPKNERILVLEGALERLSDDLPLAPRNFGVPAFEAKNMDSVDILHCRGKVWIEDAVTGANRDDIGTFAILKLPTPTDPGQYTITIPKPVRNLD